MFLFVINFKILQFCVFSFLVVFLVIWFKTYGLVVKKFIIMDVLLVIAVFYSFIYVFILDKYVVFKVFDEVNLIFYMFLVDIFFIFCSNKKQFILVLYSCNRNVFQLLEKYYFKGSKMEREKFLSIFIFKARRNWFLLGWLFVVRC